MKVFEAHILRLNVELHIKGEENTVEGPLKVNLTHYSLYFLFLVLCVIDGNVVQYAM